MKQVVATLAAVHEIILVAASDGTLAADVRPLVRMNVSVIVEQDGRREQGYAGTGGRYSLEEFVAGEKPLRLAREAVRQATVNLESVPAPAGPMTVVLGPGLAGSAAARGNRPRSRGGLQSSRNLGVHRTNR